jgi:hypothetical protein
VFALWNIASSSFSIAGTFISNTPLLYIGITLYTLPLLSLILVLFVFTRSDLKPEDRLHALKQFFNAHRTSVFLLNLVVFQFASCTVMVACGLSTMNVAVLVVVPLVLVLALILAGTLHRRWGEASDDERMRILRV